MIAPSKAQSHRFRLSADWESPLVSHPQRSLVLGWSSAAILDDLPALIAGRAEKPARRAFFRSIGLGCEDIAMAAALHELLAPSPAADGTTRGAGVR